MGTHRAQGSTIDRLVRRRAPRRDYVRTPEWIARAMVAMSGAGPGDTVVDPCAGDGAILGEAEAAGMRAFGIESHPDLFDLSLGKPGRRMIMGDFLGTVPVDVGCGRVDAVVMNPPFSGLGAWRFVRHAVDEWIRDGGACVSVVPQYVMDNSEGRKAWLDEHVWSVRILPKGAFAPDVPTLHACVAVFRRETRPGDSAYGFLSRVLDG